MTGKRLSSFYTRRIAKDIDLDYVCQSMLDNCDMAIQCKDNLYSDSHITLIFVVFGKVKGKFWKVTFNCKDIIQRHFHLDEDDSENDWLLVLDVDVSKKPNNQTDGDYIWRIHTEPTVLTLVCKSFDWQLSEIPESDYLRKLDYCI